jgi:stage II sporulation protein D
MKRLIAFLALVALTKVAASTQDRATRPRRVGDRGPLIRVALMTDLRAITLSSPSGLKVIPEPEQWTASQPAYRMKPIFCWGDLRAEARMPSPEQNWYRIEAASTPDSRRARRIADQLRAEFRAPVITTYDEQRNRYLVFFGKFQSEQEASRALRRLGLNRGARIIPPEKPQLIAYEGKKQILAGAKMAVAPVDLAGNHFELREAAKLSPAGQSTAPNFIFVGGRPYRGQISLALNRRGLLDVINTLPLEDYLRGVVPMELSPISFPELEALKAQAVAARSYALSHLGQAEFDLTDDARSQVYGGASVEHPLSDKAVEETRGIVAAYQGEPIEALYSSTCGGQTENNEAIFSGKPLPYLRSVACALDQETLSKHEIRSNRRLGQLAAMPSELIRCYAMLDVLAFKLPRGASSQYLSGQVLPDELLSWIDRAAELILGSGGGSRPHLGTAIRVLDLGRGLASILYPNQQAKALIPPADAEYILYGFGAQDLPHDARAELALLMREGILRPNLGSSFDWRDPISRAYAIEAIARAVELRKPQLQSAVAVSVAGGQLKLASGQLQVEPGAWLFSRVANQSYPVSRLLIMGGERLMYHLNAAGRADFLEVEHSKRGASSDRFSGSSRSEMRFSAEELQLRLARAGIRVGQLRDIVVRRRGESGRALEVEIIGSQGRRTLSGPQIRAAFGLKENLFAISRDELNRQMIFTLRGWGHGVGMCQTGAYELAREGYTYQQILRKYYTGIELKKIY